MLEVDGTKWRGCGIVIVGLSTYDMEVLFCLDRIHSIGENGVEKPKGQPASPDLSGKWPLKRCLCASLPKQ